MAERLRVYDEKTRPLVDFYRARGLLRVIDAAGDLDAVTRRLAHALGAPALRSAPRPKRALAKRRCASPPAASAATPRVRARAYAARPATNAPPRRPRRLPRPGARRPRGAAAPPGAAAADREPQSAASRRSPSTARRQPCSSGVSRSPSASSSRSRRVASTSGARCSSPATTLRDGDEVLEQGGLERIRARTPRQRRGG